ncbi:glycosyltransferase family 4 protein [Marinobacter sp. F4206]|uniref:glycosyltransferase family 4 protein n=1 Tax=Marinobacter sp. F4206 TaxID=2861777 RepID=UPI001C5FE531|nr:glycosyltransferase family 4 protein [Marinobacter sp. F4206]MBW4933780.1 glycosyltransferase family 4 protein [Marinobacter sp. F4206]
MGRRIISAKVDMFVWNTFQNDARVQNEADTLARAGYRVTVHALHAPGYTARTESLSSGVEVVRHGRIQGLRLLEPRKHTAGRSRVQLLTLMLSRLLTHLAVLVSLLRKRPDVIHAHDVNVLPTSWLAARLSGARLVYDAHEISSGREGYRKIGRMVACLEGAIMPRAAGSITTTDARAKFFARAYGMERPIVLQNRPRLTKVGRGNRIREELSLDEDWPIVLYQGGLQPGRGLLRLVEVTKDVPGAYFVFVGGGSQADELEQRTKELGLEDRVKFIPTVPLQDLPYYTASADIGVQPIENTCLNHFTTDSNKLFEYVVARIPVVASALPEIAQVIRKYDLGVLVKPGDSEDLADAINRLVKDPGLRKRYSSNAETAANQLNWEEQEGSLVELYERVLS